MPKYRVEYERVEYHSDLFEDAEGTEYEDDVPSYVEDYEIVDAADDDEARAIIFDAGDVVSVVRVTLVEDDE